MMLFTQANEIVREGDGKSTLDRFCAWNVHNKARGHHSKTYDVALYVTRKNIGPAGYAPVTGMCKPQRSCAVTRDSGISTAYVMAHEIGHM